MRQLVSTENCTIYTQGMTSLKPVAGENLGRLCMSDNSRELPDFLTEFMEKAVIEDADEDDLDY